MCLGPSYKAICFKQIQFLLRIMIYVLVLKGGFWLGLRDSNDQTFVWENGEDVSFSLWRRSEPQGYFSYKQGCTAMAYEVSFSYIIVKHKCYVEFETFCVAKNLRPQEK